MPMEPATKIPGEHWSAFVRKNGTPEFAAAFAPDARLEASALEGSLKGATAIGAFFSATAGGMYDRLVFTKENTAGDATYLEWEGEAFGMPVRGVTVVARNSGGLIERISLHHRPYGVVRRFSIELAHRLKGRVDPSVLRAGA
jgi:hypothetical protein